MADSPAMLLYDAAGELRVMLGILAGSPVLSLYDAAGQPRARLIVKAKLGADADDGPRLWLQDAQQFKAVVGVTGLQTIGTGESHKTSAAAVTLFGKDDMVIWRAP